MARGNVLIGQSGGPTSVINASLVGVVEAVRASRKMGRVFGMRFGIEGVLGDVLLDLSAEPAATLKSLKTTPSSALGSTSKRRYFGRPLPISGCFMSRWSYSGR